MARKKLTNSQIGCIIVLWVLLCYILLKHSVEIDSMTIFTIVASGIIVFVPIYKSVRSRNE